MKNVYNTHVHTRAHTHTHTHAHTHTQTFPLKINEVNYFKWIMKSAVLLTLMIYRMFLLQKFSMYNIMLYVMLLEYTDNNC